MRHDVGRPFSNLKTVQEILENIGIIKSLVLNIRTLTSMFQVF